MACTQLVTPNLDPVIYQSGHALTDWYGWCLAYVQTAFGTGWAGSNATEAWTDHVPVSAKHEDSNIPAGMYVPIYFSGYHGLGHFGIYKDGQVWCTPIEHKPYADQWSSIAIVEQKYGVTYVGWCEILGGTQVIEYVTDATQPVISIFSVVSIPSQVMAFNKPTHRWNLDLPTTEAMVAAPLEELPQDEQLTVVGLATHQNGYEYYLQDVNSHDGFNTLDCDPYVAPIITPPPYVPPAAPVVATPAETYTLLTSLPTYVKDTDAMSAVNSVGTLPAGTYYVWNKTGNIYQLGVDNSHDPVNNWVDTGKNVAPIVVASPTLPVTDSASTVVGSFKWFHPDDRHPEEYEALKAIVVYDMVHSGTPIRISVGQTIEIYGHFVKDGHTYLRPLTGLDQQALYYFYGIRTTDIATFSGAPFLSSKLDWVEKSKVFLESLFEKAVKSIDGVFRRKK